MQEIRCGLNRALLILLLLVPMFMGESAGQSPAGRVRGQVTDISNALVPGATISVKGQDGRVLSAVSDGNGNFHIDGLPPGRYLLTVTAKGFAVLTREFAIVAGQDLTMNTSLKIAVQQLEVVVQGKDNDQEGQGRAVGVGSDSNAGAIVISGKELDYLSDDPSELGVQLLELAGPAAGPNGGHVYVDGFASGYLPPKISIREIRINQNPFAAEQDRIGYGRVEVFTKPGSNQIHGQFFADENNSILNSGDPFLPQKLSYNSNIFTGDFWGPIKKDLTGYFSFQRRNINDNTGVNAIVVDNNFNEVPVSQSLPHSDRVNVIATRFDYQISPSNTFIGRYAYTGVADQNLGIFQNFLASKAFNYDAFEHRIQLSDNFQISPRAENDVRFEFKRSRNRAQPVNSGPGINVSGAFEGGAANIGRSAVTTDYYELQNATLFTKGRHIIKFGGRARLSVYNTNTLELFNGEFTFPSIDVYRTTIQGIAQGLTPAQIRSAGGGAEQFVITGGNPDVTVSSFDHALFIQDDWRARTNLNVTYGLRYETQNVIHDHLDFAPRFGVAWGIDGGKKGAARTILRGGAGVYYDRFAVAQEANSKRLDGAHAFQILVTDPNFFPNVPSLAQLAGSSQGALTTTTLSQTDPNYKAPFTIQMGIALERQIRKSVTASVTYLHTRGSHQLLERNINAPLPGTFDPANPAAGLRPFGSNSNIYQFQSEGVFRQHQMITSLNIRSEARLSLVVKHTLNYASGNVDQAVGFPVNQFDPTADYGRSSLDIRNRISVGGVMELPRKIRFSPFFLLKSGTPYNIFVADDLNGDSIFNDRPAFATDLSRPSVVFTRLGAFDTNPLPGQKIIPRNFATGPMLYTLNFRLGRTFALGAKKDAVSGSNSGTTPGASGAASLWKPRYTLGVNVNVQNVFNHVNPGQPEAVLSSPLFGRSNALAGGAFSSTASDRRITFQTSFTF